jgi:hypothetical protein
MQPIEPAQNHMRKIDTSVAKSLHGLRPEDVNKFNLATVQESRGVVPPKQILPVRTLWRGARMGLPSGQDVAAALEIDNALTAEEIKAGPHEPTLSEYGFSQDTPLWYYVLKEAEVREKGERLGRVGSHIVANVIVRALQSDPSSYVSVDPKWTPTIQGSPRGKISDILYFVTRRDARP